MRPYERLEAEWGEWMGYRPEQVVACSSGTAALHLALEALGPAAGSKVLVPDFSMIACPRACTLAALVPVFVDCGTDLNMDTFLATEACYSSVREADIRAVIAVHIYGRRCDMEALMSIRPASVRPFIIEDLAEAHTIKPHPDTDAACWSFYRNKHVHGEEGGAVAFRDAGHARLARQLRCLGFSENHDYRHVSRGHNYRLADSLASLVLKSMGEYGKNLQARREAEAWYDAACPGEWKMPPRESPWIYDLRVPGLTRQRQGEIVRALNAAGVQARHSFLGMHLQEEYKNCRRIGGANTERASEEVFYLPLTPGEVSPASASLAFNIMAIRKQV